MLSGSAEPCVENIELNEFYNAAMDENIFKLQKLIVSGYNFDIMDENGHTVLHYCYENNKYKSALLLINNGCNLDILYDSEQTTILITYCYYGQFDYVQDELKIIKALIDNGCNLNIQDLEEKGTALHHVLYATQCFDYRPQFVGKIAQILIEAGCRLDIKDIQGQTYEYYITNKVKPYIQKGLENRRFNNSLIGRCVNFVKKYGQKKFNIKSLNKDIRIYFI